MRRTMMVSLGCVAALAVGQLVGEPSAGAAPLAPAAAKLRLPAALSGRAGGMIKLRNGKSVSVQQLVDQAGNAPAKGGARLSLQQALDALAGLEQDLKAAPAEPDLTGATARKADLETINLPPAGMLRSKLPTPRSASISFGHEMGNREWVSGYMSLKAAQNGTMVGAGCSVAFEVGAYMRNTNYPLVKFTADYAAGSGGASGSAALYIQGQKTWGASNSVPGTDIFPSHTFATPPLAIQKKIGPFTAKGDLGASVTLGLKPVSRSSATATTLECALGVHPTVSSKVSGSASVTASYLDLEAEAGVAGHVSSSISTPIDMSITVDKSPSIRGRFMAGADLELMKGNVYAYYKVKDVCWDVLFGETCMSDIADALDIPLAKRFYLYSSGIEWTPRTPTNAELWKCAMNGFGTELCPFKPTEKAGWTYKKTWIDETFPK